MAVPDEKKLEVLNDHYKDTFSHVVNAVKLRDRLFLYLLLTLAFMFLQIMSPKAFDDAFSEYLESKIGVKVALDTTFIGGLIWFVLLSITVRYYQTVVQIERQYRYIHQLEAEVRRFFEPAKVPFSREGQSYLEDYPRLSDWVNTLYVSVFPILLLIFVTVKISIEFPYQTMPFQFGRFIKETGTWLIRFIFFAMIWVTTILYMRFRLKQTQLDLKFAKYFRRDSK